MTSGAETIPASLNIKIGQYKIPLKPGKIELKREALGINKKSERVLFDMEMRRDLSSGSGVGDVGCGGQQHNS